VAVAAVINQKIESYGSNYGSNHCRTNAKATPKQHQSNTKGTKMDIAKQATRYLFLQVRVV
jgi:hypothetical protein